MSNVLVEMIARTIKCLINTQFRAISDLVRDQLSASASRSGVDKNSSGKGVSTAESTGPVVSLQSSDEPYRAVTLAALNKYAQVVPQDRERASWSDVDKVRYWQTGATYNYRVSSPVAYTLMRLCCDVQDGKRDRELLQHWTKLREDIQAKFASPSTGGGGFDKFTSSSSGVFLQYLILFSFCFLILSFLGLCCCVVCLQRIVFLPPKRYSLILCTVTWIDADFLCGLARCWVCSSRPPSGRAVRAWCRPRM